MKRVVEAFWDSAALGIRTQVLNLPEDATLGDLSDLTKMDAPYQVVRLPVAAHGLLHEVQARDFVFAELQIRMHHDAKIPALTGPYARAVESVAIRDATRSDIELIVERIESGIFRTDRIALDPRFGVAVSARRYSLWLRKAIEDGALCHVLTRSDVLFGFSLQQRESQSLRGLLGALLDAPSSRGMGWCLPYFEIAAAVRHGASSGVYVTFSSNNPAVQRAAEKLGFRVVYQEYIFVNNSTLCARVEVNRDESERIFSRPFGRLSGTSGSGLTTEFPLENRQ